MSEREKQNRNRDKRTYQQGTEQRRNGYDQEKYFLVAFFFKKNELSVSIQVVRSLALTLRKSFEPKK